MKTPTLNDQIEQLLRKKNEDLGIHFTPKSDVLALKSSIRFGLDDMVRKEIETLNGGSNRAEWLTVLIETTGGYVEVVERIYAILRKHYKRVRFIVPNYAYSAGTVLVLSGDEIYMDYYSVLGPIDPQYESEGNFLPGLGYLAKFEELVKKINDPTNGPNAKAELAYLIKKFEPATLFLLEQAKSHSESLLIDWLSLHKFKDWNQTATSKTTVTSDMRKARAKQIAEVLGDATRWHSHGRGIGLRELTSDEIKLQIFDFGSMDALNRLVRDYYETLCDFAGRTPAKGYIHTVNGLRRLT